MSPLAILGLLGLGGVVIYATTSTAHAAPTGSTPAYPIVPPTPAPAPGPIPVFPPAQPQPPSQDQNPGVSPMPLPYWPDTPQNWPGAPTGTLPSGATPIQNPDGTVTIGDVTYTPPTTGPSTPGWTGSTTGAFFDPLSGTYY